MHNQLRVAASAWLMAHFYSIIVAGAHRTLKIIPALQVRPPKVRSGGLRNLSPACLHSGLGHKAGSQDLNARSPPPCKNSADDTSWQLHSAVALF